MFPNGLFEIRFTNQLPHYLKCVKKAFAVKSGQFQQLLLMFRVLYFWLRFQKFCAFVSFNVIPKDPSLSSVNLSHNK
ncbi:hypothetical protein Nmel_015157, partial [Mimus melanotis]